MALIWEDLAQTLARDASEKRGASNSIWDQLGHALEPIEERPRVVRDIEASHQTTRHDTPYVVIRNPAANTYLRLDPKEFDLLSLMDGTRTIKELVIEYFRRNGVLAVPRVTGLVQRLASHHFLDQVPVDSYATLGTRLKRLNATNLLSQVIRRFLFSEISLHNIDTQLGRLYQSVGWIFFTRPAVLVGLVLSILGPFIYLHELAEQRYALLQFGGSYVYGFVLILALQSLTLIIHELGHAMAVKHAGRHVPRGGLLLYYGLPAGYVDTTDIWMSPRARRLITSFAGPYTGLVLGGACAVATFLLPESALGAFLFTWGFILILNALLNFNPLLELDGYYLLVDLLEKPSLRARAFSFVRNSLWKKVRGGELLTREEKFLALFGFASVVYSVLAIYLAVQFWQMRVGNLVTEVFASGNPVAQGAVILIAALIVIPLVLGVLALIRRLVGSASSQIEVLGERAAAHLHREAVDALRAVPLWKEMPESRLLELARAMRAENAPEGTEIVRQGEAGDRFYIIVHGGFEVIENGEPVKRLARGNYFGEMALIYHAPRFATVVAVEPSRVLYLEHDAFDELLLPDLQTRAKIEAAVQYHTEMAAMPLFRDLPPADLDLLLSKMVSLSVAPGKVIMRQGETGDKFYIVRSGQVEILQDGEIVAMRGRGEAVGEIALLLNVPRTATVRAIEPTELLSLSREDFHDILLSYLNRNQELVELSQMRMPAHKRLDQLSQRTSSSID